MLHKALVLALVAVGIASCVSCGTTSNHYLFATIPQANEIVAYREDPNSGTLTQILGSPYAAGDGAHSVVVHPSGSFLYVANPGVGANGEDDISLFTITNGALTEQPPRTPLGNTASVPQILAMDPGGSFLYSMNVGSNNISVFSIASSGGLTQVANSPFSIGFSPLNMQLSPSGNSLYVSGVGSPNGSIATFSASGGQLTLVGLVSSEGVNPYGMTIDPKGGFLYAANFGSNSIATFAIDPSLGTLTEVAGSPINDNGFLDPIAMVFEPSGTYLYVANQGSASVAIYTITSSGLPSALTSENSYGTQPNPSFLATDPNGKYLFVGGQGAGATIQPFEISSGTLIGLFFYNVGNTPSSIAVMQ